MPRSRGTDIIGKAAALLSIRHLRRRQAIHRGLCDACKYGITCVTDKDYMDKIKKEASEAKLGRG